MIDHRKLEIGEHYDLLFMASRFTARCVAGPGFMPGFLLSIPIEHPPRFIFAENVEQARRIPKPRIYDATLQKVEP